MKLLFFLFVLCPVAVAAQDQFHVLVFSKTAKPPHASIEDGVKMFERLAAEHRFSMVHTKDLAYFQPDSLAKVDVLVFLSTNGNIFETDAQRQAFQAYMDQGGAFLGIHNAVGTEENWPWYVNLVGTTFKEHPRIQTAQVRTLATDHPATQHLPERWLWTEEWYVYDSIPANVEFLLAVEESSYDPTWSKREMAGMGQFHPVAWCSEEGPGRSIYIQLGHRPAAYYRPEYEQLVFGALWWAWRGR